MEPARAGASFRVDLPLPEADNATPPPRLVGMRVAVLSKSMFLAQTVGALALSMDAAFVRI